MKEAVVHEFDPVIYPYRIWVIINKTVNVIEDRFKEYDGKPIHFEEGDIGKLEAFTMMVQSKEKPKYGSLLFFPNKKCMTYELVAHEASHAAKHLFEHIGADIKEHEPFEYVLGWIAGCCEDAKKWKK